MKIDIVTVVFREEIDFLKLQAKSIAKFFNPDAIGKILIIINDAEEDRCYSQVEALLETYGTLREKVRIVRPSEIFIRSNRHLRIKSGYQWRTFSGKIREIRLRYFLLKKEAGWKGFGGSRVQQALKLASARYAMSDYILILDAKNHFLKAVGLNDFVAENGRPKCYLVPNEGTLKKWVDASFSLFGLSPPQPSESVLPSITPFCVERRILLSCLNFVETKAGPIQWLFIGEPKRKRPFTEFTMLFAYVTKEYSSWKNIFSLGLERPATIFISTNSTKVDNILTRIEKQERNVFSIHKKRINGFDKRTQQRIIDIWTKAGLIDCAIKFDEEEYRNYRSRYQ
jgi:hypothetical protein